MKKIIITVLSFILMFFLILTGLRPVRYDIIAGSTAPADIYAKREITDKLTTEKRRTEAEAELQDQYEISADKTAASREALSAIRREATDNRPLAEEARTNTFAGAELSAVYAMDDDAFSRFFDTLESVQSTLLSDGIAEDADIYDVSYTALSGIMSIQDATSGAQILSVSTYPNKIYSSEKTDEARSALRESIPDVTYKANQIIVRKGDIITQAQFAVLSDLGMVKTDKSGVDFRSIVGAFILLFASFSILYLYLRRYADEYLKNDGLLLMIAILFTLPVLVSAVDITGTINPYLLPLIAGTALLAILVDIRFAILYNAITALLCVFVFHGDLYYLSCLLLSGTFSALLFTRRGMRSTLVFSALILSFTQLVLYFGVALLEGLEIRGALLRGGYGFLSGVVTSIVVIGLLPFLEYAFDVTTPYKLLELSNPEQPLLKRLLTDAPGTYHHSLMVGNLAEAACDAIGANALLARTGAYYHDVGKLRHPQYFKENQYAENPHDQMSPILSANVIIAHVRDGEELAREYRLPTVIRGFISSHHGTSLVSFFYHKATIENEGKIDAAPFHYPGPRPCAREEAIVMLADSTEAAVRSLESKDTESIREMVHKIIQGKLADGQLGTSDLTLQDIETIELRFIHVFSGYFHSRIQYPDSQNPGKEDTHD